ncbi:MAG: hypothetical protein KF769_14380 [Parvibaculum sp.]|nr:hypothetical protein [Parvibaculum sp.]
MRLEHRSPFQHRILAKTDAACSGYWMPGSSPGKTTWVETPTPPADVIPVLVARTHAQPHYRSVNERTQAIPNRLDYLPTGPFAEALRTLEAQSTFVGLPVAQIVYLDQNKWVALSCAVKAPDDYPALYSVLECCVEKAKAGDVIFPLTQTNIYETYKINVFERRHDVAFTQSSLSQGLVFRGRYKRLEVEVTNVIRSVYGIVPSVLDENWFLSNIFFESTFEWNDPKFANLATERAVEEIRKHPQKHLYKFLMETPDDIRRMAVIAFSEGSRKLCAQIEERRTRDTKESVSMRRKIHSALLIANELDLILNFIRQARVPNRTENEILAAIVRKLVNDCPTYFVEREIALRLEAQSNRPIVENDLRDMQTFCGVVPYADIIVAENEFSNLARQAGVNKKYGAKISTDLLALPELL